MSLLNFSIFHPVLMLSAFIGTADGFYEYMMLECVYSTSDYSDMVFLVTMSFNKVVDAQYNSTLGKFVGFNEHAEKSAERWNKNQAFMQGLKADVDTVCRHYAKIFDSAVRDKTVLPKVKLSSVKKAEGNHPAVLMCSAYEFYPEKIKVSWLRDGKLMTSEVTSTMEMADGDWYYQIHSQLEYTPTSGEKISCVVEHASSTQPIVKDWNPSMPESERNKITIGSSGLVLGIIIAAAGLIYYKKKSSGRILVPN
ncbi:H-2 class II histocompatibility antigen, E-S beta chain isoform X2 [Siphateles boraxobius]|uniref:H-2 class II histocompatibility antigen, E-S beta chain isoform X2 n=1 Tax=Siphateles boraxobius TaxID=180520 RepID=UPI004064652A